MPAPTGRCMWIRWNRPFEAPRFPVSGGVPEHLASFRSGPGLASALPLPGDRVLLGDSLAGRNRLMLARPGRDPVPFVESDEETAPPIARVGESQVAFLAGSGADRMIVIAALSDGRIKRARRRHIVQGRAVRRSRQRQHLDAAGGEPRRLATADTAAIAGARLSRLPLAGGPEVPIPYARDLPIWSIYGGAAGRDGRVLLEICPVDDWYCPAGVLDSHTGKVTRIPVAFWGRLQRYPMDR